MYLLLSLKWDVKHVKHRKCVLTGGDDNYIFMSKVSPVERKHDAEYWRLILA